MQERMLRAKNWVHATLGSVETELAAAKKTLEHMQNVQRQALAKFEVENKSRLTEIDIKQQRIKALQEKRDMMAN